MACATVQLILVTQRGIREQGNIAQQSLLTSIKAADAAIQAVNTERAWLTFETFDAGDFINGRINDKPVKKGIVIILHFKNTGRSPAIILKTELGFKTHPVNTEISLIKLMPHSIAVVGPGGTFSSPHYAFDDGESYLITSQASLALVVFRIEYNSVADPVIRNTETCVGVKYQTGTITKDGKENRFLGGPSGPQNSIS